jgi:hypothetical protein
MSRSGKEKMTERVEEVGNREDGQMRKSEAKRANFFVGSGVLILFETKLADNEVHSVSYPLGPISTSS